MGLGAATDGRDFRIMSNGHWRDKFLVHTEFSGIRSMSALQ
jgi:hypothetical protein